MVNAITSGDILSAEQLKRHSKVYAGPGAGKTYFLVENVKNNLQQSIYKTIIPRNVRLAEAPSHGLPINVYDTKSAGAESYRLLAEEVIHREDEEWL